MDKGQLVFEYNMMIIERYRPRASNAKLDGGQAPDRGDTKMESAQPLRRPSVMLSVDGTGSRRGTTLKRTVPAAFSASETFDVGTDLGSTVSLDYFDRRPFRFEGKIEKVDVKLQ